MFPLVLAQGTGLYYIVIAVGFAVAGLLIAWLVLRFTNLKPPYEFGPVEALIGVVYGILLAILVLFASQHYTAAVDNADREATSLNDMYKAVGPQQPDVRDELRHEVVCYAREKIELEWHDLRKSNGKGSAEVFARTRQLNGSVEAVAASHPDSLIASTLFNANLQRAEARQLMLEESRPQLPAPLWFVVLLGIGIVVFLIAIRYWDNRAHLLVGLATSLALLLTMVWAIAELDRPFASVIGLQPRAMESVLTSVVQSSSHSTLVFRECTPPPAA